MNATALANLLESVAAKQSAWGCPRARSRWLILSATGNAHGLVHPFHVWRQALADHFGVVFQEHISDDLADKRARIAASTADVIMVSMPLRVNGKILPPASVREFFLAIDRSRPFKLVYFDISDNAVSPHFDILPLVDLFLMPFTFRDAAQYARPFRGGNILADYLADRFQLSATPANGYYDHLFLSRPAPDQLGKIMTSWNWMLWRSLFRAFRRQGFRCRLGGARTLDVTCRFNPYSGWCGFHRAQAAERLNALASRHAVVATAARLPVARYYQELAASKIAFSPFGYGEICPKDFEAVMHGCLLVKPSVEHLNAYPQLHVAGETYVPVAWDLADLEEKLDYYLSRPEERQRITANAARAYEAFFANDGFLAKIGEIQERLGR